MISGRELLGVWEPGTESWGLALNASGYVAIDTIGQWAGMATRVPRGDQTGSPRHLDIIAVPGPGMVRFDPKVVSVGTDTELDTPRYASCSRAKGPDCPSQCEGPATNSGLRNPPRHIPDFEKNQLFYRRPDLPHS